MQNQFFENKGPFEVHELLTLADINIKKKFSKININDIKDLSTS